MSERHYPARIELDGKPEMLYVCLAPAEHGRVVRTQDFGRVRLDFDAQGNVYGVEVDGPLGEIEVVDPPSFTVQFIGGSPTITTPFDAGSLAKPDDE